MDRGAIAIMKQSMRLLAGDVGGTKTLLALFEGAADQLTEVRRERFESHHFEGLTEIVRAMLGDDAGQVDRAAFGVAGPVVDDTCKATNLPWQIDARSMERELGIERICLLNDFHAIALGTRSLGPDDLVVLQDQPAEEDGPVAILGAGTGLGESIVVPTGAGPRVLDSEGGHADFAPRNDTEMDLLRFLLARHDRVSVERVVSGAGLHAIYQFLVESGRADVSEDVAARLRDADDPAAVIGQAAVDGDDDTCRRSVEIFVSLYGAEAGNLALKVLPRGGLFVAGGIAPKLLPFVRRPDLFLESYLAKGRMRPLLERMRVSIITDTNVGLYGARNAAAAL